MSTESEQVQRVEDVMSNEVHPLIHENRLVVVPGVYDVLSAKLA